MDEHFSEQHSEEPKIETAEPVKVTAIKGFDADFQCRGVQFEVGKTYHHDGQIKICERGFHAIEGHPLEVFDYYPAANSRFAVVEQWGELERHSQDSKLVSASITIKAEINLPELIKRAVDWVFARAKPEEEGSHATGERGAASATGGSGAASATGGRGAASATGERGAASATGGSGAASATGWSGAASATGWSGAASATGGSGAASATGEGCVAMSIGVDARAKGSLGNAICLVHRDAETGEIIAIRATKIGENGVAPDVFYSLSREGEFVRVQEDL